MTDEKKSPPLPSLCLGLFDLLGEETVQITVGSGDSARTFTVHKKILCKKVPYFDKMFNGSFKEGQNQSASMPEDDPDAFSTLLGWVYLDSIEHHEVLSTDKKSRALETIRYINLFALAEKLNIRELSDRTMDFQTKEALLSKVFPSTDNMIRAYNLTSTGSKLRLYVARCLAFVITSRKHNCTPNSWPSSELFNTMVEVPELGNDCMALLRGQSGKAAVDPRDAPSCDYHHHTAKEVCRVGDKITRWAETYRTPW